MIEKLTPSIRGIIMDMDGVIWRGNQPLGNLPVIFQKIADRGISVLLATNNATRSIDQYVERLQGYGVPLERWQVINSAQSAAHTLSKQYPYGGPVYLIGESGLEAAFRECGFFPSDESALAVVAGLDRGITYEKLRRGSDFIRGGSPFIGTNPDATFPAPDGVIPGAGSILAALQVASGVKPMIAGKPERAMFDLGMERLGTTPQETLVIGDRLETDIAGGQNVGCRTALVLSGVTTPAEAQAWTPPPDLIAPDLTTLVMPG